MKTNRKTKILIGGAAVIVLAGLGALAWFLIPGLRASSLDYAPTGVPPTATEYWPTDGWRISTPEQQGFDSMTLAEGLQTLHKNQVAIDSLLIIRNGYVILESYFYPYEESFPHDLASVTKSVTTTLIAIAAEQGKLQLDQPMVSYFPDRTIANLDDRKQAITVRNLSGMVNGMKSGCISGDEDTLDAMRSQADWVQAALDRKMSNPPGKVFCYDSPGIHLLSAILQETTGMTELEFAQQNLFEPLGIQDVYWESDPQGYTHGWGDLHLMPKDAAKIGYLFLQNGVWEGRQIVPAAWVAEAVKENIKTGRADNYGYGWWVSDNSYFALGRNGQHIKVYPALNMIVVTTAGNLEYALIDRLLEKAFVDPENPLPANQDGMAQLEAVLTEINQGQAAQPAISLPETAGEISGKIYACEENSANVNTLRFEFSGLDVAEMYLGQSGRDFLWTIGLDGKYRMTPEGLTRGHWEDPQTFIIELFDIGLLTREFRFDGDRLDVRIPEINLTLKCQVKNP
jgi:CubicO group peptidase (beta-lactamase class C family)